LHDNTLKETVYKKNKLNFRIPGHFYNRSAYCVIPPSLKRCDKYVNNVAGYSEVAPKNNQSQFTLEIKTLPDPRI